jgi:hypothetical protein
MVAAVAALLLHFDGGEAATLKFHAHAAAPLPLSKAAVRTRLRLISACHPHAQPTASGSRSGCSAAAFGIRAPL